MTPLSRVQEEGIVVVIGQAHSLASYLALARNRIRVEHYDYVPTHLTSDLRSYHRPIVIIGALPEMTTNLVVTLHAIRAAGATLLSVEHSPTEFGGSVSAKVFSWVDVAWFVPETFLRYPVTAESRVTFAEGVLAEVPAHERDWFACALMACPEKSASVSKALSVSRSTFNRRMAYFGETWHALSDRMVIHVCTLNAQKRDVKARAVASELAGMSDSQLSRRLGRLGTSWRELRSRERSGPVTENDCDAKSLDHPLGNV
jgi:hypothetical protein